MTPLVAAGAEGKAAGWLGTHRDAYATVAQITAGSGVSRQTVARLLAALDAGGWLDVRTTWPRAYRLRAEPA